MKKLLVFLSLSLLTIVSFSQKEETEAKELKPALLVLDVQKSFINWMEQEHLDTRYAYINYAINLFRAKDLPVIRIYHTTPGQGPEEGTEEFEFVDKIQIKDSDPKVVKNYGNAFKKTDLDKVLKDKDVNTIFIVGLSGTGCVLATYFGGSDRDYATHLIKGAVISPKAEYTKVIEESQNALSVTAVSLLLEYGLK